MTVNERLKNAVPPTVGDLLPDPEQFVGEPCTDADCELDHGGPDDQYHLAPVTVDVTDPEPPASRFPDFEGRQVRHGSAHLTATIGDVDRAYHHGDTVIFVGRYRLDDVRHPMKNGGLSRKQILSAGEDVYELTDAAVKEFLADAVGQDITAAALVAAAQAEAIAKNDERDGRLQLPFTGLDDDVDADPEGDALADLAVQRGEHDTHVRVLRDEDGWHAEFPESYPPPEGAAPWNAGRYSTLADCRGMVEARLGSLTWVRVQAGEYEAELPEQGDQ